MIAIATQNPDTPSETYVRQHIELIKPGETAVIYFKGKGLSISNNIPKIKIRQPKRNFKSFFSKIYHFLFWGHSNCGLYNTKELREFILTNNIKLIYAEFGQTGCELMKICNKLKIPLIVNFHGYDATVMPKKFAVKRAYKILNKKTEKIICGSNHFKQILIDLKFDKKKIQVIPCGILIEKFRQKSERDSNLIIAIGRLTEKKGPQYTIRAFSKVSKIFPQVRLEIIGDGYLLDECLKLTNKLMINEKVIFHGAQDNSFVQERLQQASIFVQHSIKASNGDMESQGISLIEAMASGIPTVVTDHNGFKETVSDEKTGFLIPERNINLMSEKIIQLIENRTLREQMGANGQKKVENEFDANMLCYKITTIIENILNRTER